MTVSPEEEQICLDESFQNLDNYIDEEETVFTQTSAIVELHLSFDTLVRLLLLREIRVFGVKRSEFEISFKSVKLSNRQSSPKDIDVNILIKGSKIPLSSKTKIETLYKVVQKKSWFGNKSTADSLRKCIYESLSGICLFISERLLLNNITLINTLKHNSEMKQKYVNSLLEEKKAIESLNSEKRPPIEEWRSKCCKDGVWLKWIVERLESPEQVEQYNELRERIHDKHGLTQADESMMLRFLIGLNFDLDLVETKVVNHIKFMEENNYWNISEDRVAKTIKSNILVIYRQDIYERPINYVRIGRFNPNDFEFEEIRDYCFYNTMLAFKAFKSYVQSTTAIYDLKGMSRKNINLSLFKKLGPDLEDNNPELSPCIYLVRQPFIVNIIWKLVKPFMQKATIDKFRFLSDKQMGPELLKIIAPEDLPVVYGGSNTEFEELYP